MMQSLCIGSERQYTGYCIRKAMIEVCGAQDGEDGQA